MTEQHEPRPEFLEHLEWQIRTEARRQERFDTPAQDPWWRRSALRTAALVVISVLLGFAGATAAQEGSERHALELLERQGRLQVEMAELQQSLAADQLAWMEGLVQRRAASEGQRAMLKLQRDMLEREVAGARLELEELRAAGRPANDDLAAPPVDGRDFVRERLQLRLADMQARLTMTAFQVEQVAGLVEAGSGSPLDLAQLELQQDQILREVSFVRRELALRERFLDGELEADAVRTEHALLEARLDADSARRRVETARTRLEHALETDGFSEIDRSTAGTRLRMAEVQAEIAEARLRYLRQQSGAER